MAGRTTRNLLRLLAAITILGVGIFYASRAEADFAILLRVHTRAFALVSVGMLGTFLTTALTFRLLVGSLGIRLEAVEWIGLTFVANALNYLGPIRPGVLVKATYLKRSARLRYSYFSSTLAAKLVLFLAVTSTAALVAIARMGPARAEFRILSVLCAAILAVSLLPMIAPSLRLPGRGRILDGVNAGLEGFEIIRSQRWRAVGIGLSILLQHIVSAVTTTLAFTALGFPMSFPIALALVCLASISNVLALTPNNLGVQELVVATIYSAAGLDFAAGILGATLVRAAHLLVTFLGAPVFAFLLSGDRRLALRGALEEDRDLLPGSRAPEGEP